MGIYLMEIILASLFFLAQNEFGAQSTTVEGILMCIFIAITIVIQCMMSSSFDSLTNYLPADAEKFPCLEILTTGNLP